MPIILFLGRDIKEYIEKSDSILQELLSNGDIACEFCLRKMKLHSKYKRGIKETGQRIEINMVWCRKCKKWHSLLPDFLLPRKHYSGNEIESVIIDSATDPVNQIETAASETTVKRWIKQIGERANKACSILKYIFMRAGRAISEVAIITGSPYSELEQILSMAPKYIKYSGNKLGLANLWLGKDDMKAYI